MMACAGAALLTIASAGTARAAQPSPSEQLQSLEQEAAQSRARAAALDQRMNALKQELEAQQHDLSNAASAVQESERGLSKLETEQTELARRRDEVARRLATDRQHLAGVTDGLVRLARIPPGGLLAWPGAPIAAARGEVLLEAALSSVRMRMTRTESELADLNALERATRDKRQEAEHAAVELHQRQSDLGSLIEKRQAVYQQTESDRRTEAAKATAIAAKAHSLRDLMAQIEAERAEQTRHKASLRAPPPGGPFVASKNLPVTGEIRVRFGQNDGLGATSHGVTMITRPGAVVTAPAAGVVRFAGPFRSYREILILEHPGGYHSLIAGMARTDVAVGASVAAGEPVGTMDDRAASRPELYYELRRNGQPVDPAAVAVSADAKGMSR